MKKVTLLLAILGFSVFTVQAQYYYVQPTSTFAHRAIIRAVDNTRAISYVRTSTKSYFVHLKSGTTIDTIASFDAGSDIVVRDFQVVNGKVIFCGSKSGLGIIGHFNVNDHTTSASFNSLVYTVNKSTVLNRIAVAYVNGKYAATAIGRARTGSTLTYDPDTFGADLILFSDDATTTSSLKYRYDTNATRELYWDVVTTNNYFTTISCPDLYSTIRIHTWPTNISRLSWDSYLATNYDFYVGYASLAGKNRMAYLKDDIFSVATLYCLVTGVYATHLYTFHIPNSNEVNMKSAQSFSLPSKTDPTEMAYLKNHETLVLLEQFPQDSLGHDIPTCIHLKPETLTDYTALRYSHISLNYSVSTHPDTIPSITPIDGSHYAAVAGSRYHPLGWIYTSYSAITAPASCIASDDIEVKSLSLATPTITNTTLNTKSGSSTRTYHSITCTYEKFSQVCY